MHRGHACPRPAKAQAAHMSQAKTSEKEKALQDDLNKVWTSHQILCQWVDLRENLQETIGFPMKYGIFL